MEDEINGESRIDVDEAVAEQERDHACEEENVQDQCCLDHGAVIDASEEDRVRLPPVKESVAS
jgi:hypothetical protein